MRRETLAFAAAILLTLGPGARSATATLFVDPSAPGANDGSSWANAYIDLQSALSVAAAEDTVLVAGGHYVPGTQPTDTFELPSAAVVLGGFAGYLSPTPEERDFEATASILSGEIGSPPRYDNCQHVVTAVGTASGTVLDGFTVTRGHAGGAVYSDEQHGGGIFLEDGELTLRNTYFLDNRAERNGAGIYAFSSSITLETVKFRGGVAGWDNGCGGGLYVRGLVSAPPSANLTDCSFVDNVAELDGGGMFFSGGLLTLERCVFERNSADDGGGLWVSDSDVSLLDVEFRYNVANDVGGAIYTRTYPLRIVNGLFWRNSSNVAGAVLLGGSDVMEPQELTNCTFAENVAGYAGALYAYHSGTPVMTNCVLWANPGDWGPPETVGDVLFSHSILAGSGGSEAWDPAVGIDGGGNLDVDPAFEFMVVGNLRLTAGSAAIDAGDPGAPNLPDHDLDGNPRILGAGVDMGTYEFTSPLGVDPLAGVPTLLRPVYPNPARSDVNVSFELRRPSEVRLSIYDVNGRLVRDLVTERREPGVHHSTWSPEDALEPAAPGVYFVRLRAGTVSESRRIVVLR